MASPHSGNQGHCRPSRRSPTTSASISTVRCEGTPQPENNAYNKASPTPPTPAATGTGTASRSPGRAQPARRHSAPTTRVASQANMVTCSPEMLIKWATPVVRNSAQSLVSMALWSPTTSAASTPALRGSSTRCTMRSLTHWRARSSGCQPLAPRCCGAGSRGPLRT